MELNRQNKELYCSAYRVLNSPIFRFQVHGPYQTATQENVGNSLIFLGLITYFLPDPSRPLLARTHSATKMCSQQKWRIDVQIQKGFIEDSRSWNQNLKTSLTQLTSTSMTRSTKKRINGSKQRRKTKETPSLLIEKCQIIEKQWKATADDCKILDEQNRYVVPKKEIFTVLANCHSAIAHRGRHKTEDYVKKRYSGITQKVVNLFISMCTLHLQQKSVTDHQTNSNRWLHEPCANWLNRFSKFVVSM